MNSNQTPEQSASRGRPRSMEVHDRILDATLASLAEVGVEKLSIEMVAQRAGVGKTSIYRRWANKEALIVDSLERLKPSLNTAVQGELPDAILELARSFANRMNNPLGRQMLSLLVSTLSGSTQISESYWENHSLPTTKEISTLLESYRQSEQLRDDADLDLVSEFMIAFVMYQLLFKSHSNDLEQQLKPGINILLNGIKRK
ncbi:TetR/AcrR family transcriptional regulator [Paenibacillus sp. NEAU-GSW1]|uniref:TetR/AcrR family transcriptional regulator n=1 Tax=Paenibacillus sp. NEAU-GSW1 TaxID=2682486 RepID=UPI0012E154E7|nr:TetR/AcrR family transcriptional regulator [Paenibacillus sp. NEAU-GSW1]MUT64710.1 TetR family transcriptional regulator [Paenibacillus sp. NEAU-GSW1]